MTKRLTVPRAAAYLREYNSKVIGFEMKVDYITWY
jgi:hypothetical protein